MMLSPKGEKLSKRHAAVCVQDYRDKGYPPTGVLNYLVRFGWSYGDQEIFSREELVEAFRLGAREQERRQVRREEVRRRRLRAPEAPGADAARPSTRRRCVPFLAERGLASRTRRSLLARHPRIRERARTFEDAAHAPRLLLPRAARARPEGARQVPDPEDAARLAELGDALAALDDWRRRSLEAAVRELGGGAGPSP